MDRRRRGINKALSSHEQVPVNFCTEYISSVLRLTCCFHGIFCRSVFEITMKMKNKITTSHAFTFFFRVGSENIDPVRLTKYYLQRFIFKYFAVVRNLRKLTKKSAFRCTSYVTRTKQLVTDNMTFFFIQPAEVRKRFFKKVVYGF